MATAQNTAKSPADIMRQNLALRSALLQSAPRMRKLLGSFTGGTPGQSTRVKLFNVGVTTKIYAEVIATYDVGTAAATPSPKSPWNIINRARLSDFDGTDRINASGYQLWVLNSIRNSAPYGYNNGSKTSVLDYPRIDTTVGTSRKASFIIELPVAYSSDDLRGAMLTQTAVGETWLSLDWNPAFFSNANADAVFNGAPTTTISNVSITTNVYQEYLLPQSIGGQVPLPTLDFMTVYEIGGTLKSADNLASGQEKLLNYPGVRQVIGAYFNFVNGGVMNAAFTDIAKFRLIANGNNVLREYGAYDKLFDQRIALSNNDLVPGTYFELHRDKPIETALYGNVQYGITPSNVNAGNTYIEVCFESFYSKGAALPGFTQGS